jgi:hypothetical protein
MRERTPGLLGAALLIATPLVAAAAVPTQATEAEPCGCAEQMDSLIAKVERVYVALPLDLLPNREAAYHDHVAAMRSRAAITPTADCFATLSDYVTWFDDGHLFLLEGSGAPGTRDDTADDVERVALDSAALGAYLAAVADPDPLEGFWYDGPDRYGVVALPSDARDLVAVYLKGGRDGWEPGMVVAEFRLLPNGAFRARMRDPQFRVRHQTAELYRGDLLRLSPGIWGRTEARGRTADPSDVHRAFLREHAPGILVLGIPSFDPQWRPALDTILATRRAEIAAADILVVDVRGNEGGSTGSGNGLRPFMGPRVASDEPPYDPVALASPEVSAYFERLIEQMGGPPTGWETLLERLRAAPGQIVPLYGDGPPDAPPPSFEPAPGPRHIAVLIDGGVVSAGEGFLLGARRHERVTIFGANTGGMIDYQNVGITRVGCPDEGILLGYPTLAGSKDLPEGGYNATGIPPDAALDAHAPDIIARVVRHYRAG